jgi:hypothetical protein
MKIIANKFFINLICLLGVSLAFAGPNPPAPTHKRPPPPPGLPIDENIFIIVLFAILFGIYIIYRHNLKTNTPI